MISDTALVLGSLLTNVDERKMERGFIYKDRTNHIVKGTVLLVTKNIKINIKRKVSNSI